MFYKYCSKKNSFLFFLLAFTKASESVFIAFIVSLYINLAQTKIIMDSFLYQYYRWEVFCFLLC